MYFQLCYISFFLFLHKAVGSCPSGMVHHENKCFYFSHGKVDWDEARRICKLMGGDLVEIRTAAEASFLSQRVKESGEDHWIGGSDRDIEGVWKWVGSGDYIYQQSLNEWIPGNPDDKGHNEDCMELCGWCHGHWNDDVCTDHERYICERPFQVIGG